MRRAAIICSIIFFGVSAGYIYAQQAREYGESDSDIEAYAGEDIVITLESNQVIGLKWRFAKPFDGKILKLVSVKFVRATARLIGIPGKEIWTFKALSPGKTTVFLKYSPSPAPNIRPDKERAFTVTVIEPPRKEKRPE